MGKKLESKIDSFLNDTCNGNYTFDFFIGESVFNVYNKELYGADIDNLVIFCYQLYDESGYPNYNMTGYFFGRKGKIEVYNINEEENDDTTFVIKDMSTDKFFGFLRLVLDTDEDTPLQYITWDSYKNSARLSLATIQGIINSPIFNIDKIEFTDEQLMD